MKTAPPITLAVVLALGLYLLVTSAFYPLGFLSVFDAKRMLQLGMFLALLLFAVGYSPLKRATLVQLMRVPKPISFVMFTLFLIGIISSLRLPHPAYSLILISGWTLSLTAKTHPEPLVYPVTSLVLITGLLLATAQLVFAIREIPSFPVRTGYSKEAVRLVPRIWWAGRACDYRYTNDKK